ncbi:MAG: UDP-N-acetylmuramate:L-alanyl-gamma-D-glutamyl-meso-diaminopimelate ligase [Thermodesulfobacteriota bacterium]|nr:UDP-N-acetylmuramate:L-alanyl-gamma-D-glutamyl-meso-diaminopimelate ligase [Thermodesulfobacteriota bacterium]
MSCNINMEQNRIPDNVKKIHMVAACGTGMGALACMLQDMGYDVTGSDENIYPPMSDFLKQKGINLFKGFKKDNLQYGPDLVIIGNAVTARNPEAVEVMERNIAFCSMPEALNCFAAKGKKIILVAGTHGKTTTASIMAHLLYMAGLDPSFMIGGILKDFNGNYRIGNGDYIVIEGDEYDTAFFDKGPKFMHFDPCVTIITGVEFDHADIFRDLDHVKDVFKKFVKGISKRSLILACDGDENLKEILEYGKCRVETYGKESADWSYRELKIESCETLYQVTTPQGNFFKVATPLMGRHNLMNALAVAGVAKKIGISDNSLVNALKTFSGIKRRQDIRGVKKGITIMDDFAHHPTAVKETISAVKPFFQKGRVIAVFEPRTNSSMRSVFQDLYPSSFDEADMVCVRKPSRIDKIPVPERLSSEKLVADINKKGTDAFHFKDTDSIITFLNQNAEKGDLLLIMSNGGFDNIHQRLLESL